jgi:hypothetical protein
MMDGGMEGNAIVWYGTLMVSMCDECGTYYGTVPGILSTHSLTWIFLRLSCISD